MKCLFFRNLKYLCQVNLKDLKKVKAAGGFVSRQDLDEYLDSLKYELYDEIKTLRVPKIKTVDESISDLINSKASLCRFGDGEFELIAERDIPFQKASPLLAQRLIEVLSSNNPDIFIAIPLMLYGSKEGIKYIQSDFWRKNGKAMRARIAQYINRGVYYASELNQANLVYEAPYNYQAYFDGIRNLWNGLDIAIICGKSVFDNIENNIFDNCNSVDYLYAPALNAFESYDAILDEARKIDKQKLIIAILGPTATILAYDLWRMGYRALDLGHIAKSYDWYLKGKTTIGNFYSPD